MDLKDKERLEDLDAFFAKLHKKRSGPFARMSRTLNNAWLFVRYDIHQGIYWAYYWAKFGWSYRPWDYEYTLRAMKHSLVPLEESVRTGDHVNGEKDAQHIRVVLELVNRLNNGYTDFERQDKYWDEIWDIIKKRMRGWWN